MPNCPKGEILRKGYSRKVHTGKTIKVPPTCINDRGKPGKGPKTLPDLDEDYHLGDFGYSTKKSETARRKALRDASEDWGAKTVLRRLNLIRNKTAREEPARKIMAEDVEYMKKYWRGQEGGFSSFSYHSSNSSSYSNINGVENKSERSSFSEKHNVDGVILEFFSVSEKDDMGEFGDRCNECNGVGLRADGVLKGYVQWREEGAAVQLINYQVEKGFNTAFVAFLYRYFSKNGYHRLQLFVNTETDATDKLNFWYEKGFKTVSSNSRGIMLGVDL